MRALNWASRHPPVCDIATSLLGAAPMPVEVFGLRFPNPVGLAAGMDKYATALPAWLALGFGFSELGGVTSHTQPGNPEPRLFRAVAEDAIVNRMGFNNPGADEIAERLAWWRAQELWPRHPVGINLGKSKITPLAQAAEDYAASFRALREHADFFVVNVSSPNTPNLRQLQDKAALDEILAALQELQSPKSNSDESRAGVQSPERPILVKVAPDLAFEALDEILELAARRNLAGIVATNTTVTRPHSKDPLAARVYAEAGGLSGKPLRARSTEIVRHLYAQTRGKLPIIGVGGIFDATDAWEKIVAGASLIQVYTGLVYEGPTLAKNIVAGLYERMEQAGFSRLEQAVGTEVR